MAEIEARTVLPLWEVNAGRSGGDGFRFTISGVDSDLPVSESDPDYVPNYIAGLLVAEGYDGLTVTRVSAVEMVTLEPEPVDYPAPTEPEPEPEDPTPDPPTSST